MSIKNQNKIILTTEKDAARLRNNNYFPDNIKKAIKEAAKESGQFEIALCRAGLDGDKSINTLKKDFNYTMEVPNPVKFMKSKGMIVSFLTNDQVKAFADATAPVIKKWADELGDDLVAKAKADMAK